MATSNIAKPGFGQVQAKKLDLLFSGSRAHIVMTHWLEVWRRSTRSAELATRLAHKEIPEPERTAADGFGVVLEENWHGVGEAQENAMISHAALLHAPAKPVTGGQPRASIDAATEAVQ